jgi:small redox-active disulfide protein 2
MQPWAMGAETIYEEDSLFNIFTEERIAWDDLLTKGKRDMTRDFFKFAKTHPRKGKNVRNIGFIEGRYAAPFNGFICDTEQDPHYSVWGKYGSNDPMWAHLQPEKCHQVLDVLMSGTSTHPLMQDTHKRRFFFAGTPYGDFDSVPVEASADFYKNYKLLLNLGWNTQIEEDYNKNLEYVKAGGVLLTGIPQFSTHTGRDFLADMKDLALWNDGDLSELCGIKVLGAGCKNCHDLFDATQVAIKNMGLSVAVEYVTDMEKIMEYGVMSMPALVVNEKVVSMGKVLKAADVEKLLRKLGY